jgi:hypothetical protein
MQPTVLAPDFHDQRAGARIEPHRHADGQALLATVGAMDVRVGGVVSRLGIGDALWVPPGVAHAALAVEATEFRGVFVALGPSARLMVYRLAENVGARYGPRASPRSAHRTSARARRGGRRAPDRSGAASRRGAQP